MSFVSKKSGKSISTGRTLDTVFAEAGAAAVGRAVGKAADDSECTTARVEELASSGRLGDLIL